MQVVNDDWQPQSTPPPPPKKKVHDSWCKDAEALMNGRQTV